MWPKPVRLTRANRLLKINTLASLVYLFSIDDWLSWSNYHLDHTDPASLFKLAMYLFLVDHRSGAIVGHSTYGSVAWTVSVQADSLKCLVDFTWHVHW